MEEIYSRVMLYNIIIVLSYSVIFFILMCTLFAIVHRILKKKDKNIYSLGKIVLIVGVVSLGLAAINIVPATIDIASKSYVLVENATVGPTVGETTHPSSVSFTTKSFVIQNNDGINIKIKSYLTDPDFIKEHDNENMKVEKIVYGKHSRILVYPVF